MEFERRITKAPAVMTKLIEQESMGKQSVVIAHQTKSNSGISVLSV